MTWNLIFVAVLLSLIAVSVVSNILVSMDLAL